MRTLQDLIDLHDPGLMVLREWADDPGANASILLPPDETVRTETLLALQVTTRSIFGAVAYETGGLSIADGLIRIVGSGREWSLLQAGDAAGLPLGEGRPDALIVADDMLGGVFALNGGRFGPDRQGEVFHLAADDDRWSPLDLGYGDFIAWCLTGDVDGFYGGFDRLPAFGARPRPAFGLVYSFYPFLWSLKAKDARPSSRIVDARESLKLRVELCGFEVA